MNRIQVIGPNRVAGIDPGEQGDVTMSFDQLSRLIRGGHIQLVAPPPTDIEEHTLWES